MNEGSAIALRGWPVGSYVCTLTMCRAAPGQLVSALIQWEPRQPTSLTDEELREYRAGRDRALAEISRELGINAAVVEL